MQNKNMTLVYSNEEAPEAFEQSIFLAGPTPRSDDVESWRGEAVEELKAQGYTGVVFIPEARSGESYPDYNDQVEWEARCLNMSDCILFWVPRELETMPAFTTNVEFGKWQAHHLKVVFGCPKDAPKTRYLLHDCKELDIPVLHSLDKTISATLEKVKDGAERTGGEREVPLFIWNTEHFQSWMQSQKQVGNRLDGAKVEWTLGVGPGRTNAFMFVVYVDVYIKAEDRNKDNEVIIVRTDIVSVVIHNSPENIKDTEIVVIKEFRSPASNEECMVYEIPGGSSKTTKPIKEIAQDEVKEETGIAIDAERLVEHGTRQLASTLSTHKCHLFSVEVSQDEMDEIKKNIGKTFGEDQDTERTYLEVYTLDDIMKSETFDWSMAGMIQKVLFWLPNKG